MDEIKVEEIVIQGRRKARRKESFEIQERKKEGEVCIAMVASPLRQLDASIAAFHLSSITKQNQCPHKPQSFLYECCHIPRPERQSRHNTG